MTNLSLRAHRFALISLGGVALFVLAVGGILFSRARHAPVDPVPGVPRADLTVKEVNIREESGKIRWHLTAKQAEVFEPEGRTSLRQVAVEVQEPERAWTVQGEEGDLFPKRSDLEIRRNVVLTSSDGLRLETSVLRWAGGEKRLWTDAPVTITNPGAVIKGTGLDVRMAEETTIVAGRVKATFHPRADR